MLFAAILCGLAPAALAGQSAAPSPLAALVADRVLAQMDLNGDHRVARAEFRAVRQQRFSMADSNRDRLITPQEFRAELVDVAGGIGLPWSAQLFMAIDRDADGLMAPDELDAAGEALFTRADRNGDGFVTAQEIYPALAQLP
jgi:hypothetical protein